MRFEWDEAKNVTNQKKHGISFDTAVLVFDDPNMVQFIERIENGEERWHAIGYAPGSLFLILTVVHTWNERNHVVRIISARHASNAEMKTYDQASL